MQHVSLGIVGPDYSRFIALAHDVTGGNQREQKRWEEMQSDRMDFGQIIIDSDLIVGLFGIQIPTPLSERGYWHHVLTGKLGCVVLADNDVDAVVLEIKKTVPIAHVIVDHPELIHTQEHAHIVIRELLERILASE